MRFLKESLCRHKIHKKKTLKKSIEHYWKNSIFKMKISNKMKNNLCSYDKVTHGEITAVISRHFHEFRMLFNCGTQ